MGQWGRISALQGVVGDVHLVDPSEKAGAPNSRFRSTGNTVSRNRNAPLKKSDEVARTAAERALNFRSSQLHERDLRVFCLSKRKDLAPRPH